MGEAECLFGLTRKFAKTVRYNISTDNSLVENFNSVYGEEYSGLPENSYELVYTNEIVSGQESQKLTVQFKNLIDLQLSAGTYLLPLEIKLETEDEYLYLNKNANVTYLFLEVYDKGGLRFMSKLDSSVFFDCKYCFVVNNNGTDFRFLIDGDFATTWSLDPSENNYFIIDMGKKTDVTALVFQTAPFVDYELYFTDYFIYSSDDNTIWEPVGRFITKPDDEPNATQNALVFFFRKKAGALL